MRNFSLILSCALLLCPAPGRAEEVRDLIAMREADARLLEKHWQISGDSLAALEREAQMLAGWQERLRGLDFARQDQDGKVDWILLRYELDAAQAHLKERKRERRHLAAWLPCRETVETLTDARVSGQPGDAAAAAKVLAGIPDALKKTREALEERRKNEKPADAPAAGAEKPDAEEADDDSQAGSAEMSVPAPWQALAAARIMDDQAAALDQWQRNFAEFVPGFSWWVDQPAAAALTAMRDYAKYLREECAGVKGKDDDPLIGHPIGARALRRELAFEFIAYTPEELLGIADREFAWCEDRMKEAARDMGHGDDWKAALEQVKAGYGAPGTQEQAVREEARDMIAWLKANQLVTIPPDCEEWWGTRMLMPDEQRHLPFAAYSGHDVVIAYAAASMSVEEKLMAMRGNSRPFLHTVIPHELIPGHHLQGYMAARYRPWRAAFRTPFLIEGWALHWEMQLWDRGWHTTPEQKIGALFWRMHRCARIMVTLRFHTGKMTPDEMIAFLTDRVGHEKSTATSEVRRFISGGYPPLYQCAYMLGGLQLRALHAAATAGGAMTSGAFHDRILTLGPIPVELLRASILNLPLQPDTQATWRFAEP